MVENLSACNLRDPGSIPGWGRSPWRSKWQTTPVFLLGEFHGQKNLSGYSPWGHKESDTSERLTLSVKEGKKKVYHPLCRLMRADLGNHRTFCLESRQSTSLALQLLAEFTNSIRQGRCGGENLKKQDTAKLLNQEREWGCKMWTFQRS